MSLTKKIDFALIISVQNANPNGDPLNGNRPRADFSGFGEMTDVCLKRKIRDRLQDAGESIFVQSDEKKTDGITSSPSTTCWRSWASAGSAARSLICF